MTLNQWAVTIGDRTEGLFTPVSCDEETALAIAVATFGAGVTDIEDEGKIRC